MFGSHLEYCKAQRSGQTRTYYDPLYMIESDVPLSNVTAKVLNDSNRRVPVRGCSSDVRNVKTHTSKLYVERASVPGVGRYFRLPTHGVYIHGDGTETIVLHGRDISSFYKVSGFSLGRSEKEVVVVTYVARKR